MSPLGDEIHRVTVVRKDVGFFFVSAFSRIMSYPSGMQSCQYKGKSSNCSVDARLTSNLVRSLFPAICPASAIHASLGLLTDVLPAILAFDLALHDIVSAGTTVAQRNDP